VGLLEQEAHRLLSEKKYDEAAEFFYRAARAYQEVKNHQAAALCFASAAGCWAAKCGEQPYYNAAKDYERAAMEAVNAGDYLYAALLYKHSAICHEKDADYSAFSDCFFKSKEYYRKHLFLSFFNPGKTPHIQQSLSKSSLKEKSNQFRELLTETFLSFLWGHGERPGRTVFFGISFILLCALLFTTGTLVYSGVPHRHPNILETIYFSVVTFTTLGYGDISPVGFNRCVSIVESLGGLFIVPIFIAGLLRKYCRF
jgi:hypothetical protein